MSPFEMPFELMRQWMDLATAMNKAAVDVMTEGANQARREMDRSASVPAMVNFAPANWAAANPFLQAFGMPSPAWSPFAAWGMPTGIPGFWGFPGWPSSGMFPGSSAGMSMFMPWMGFGMWDNAFRNPAFGSRSQLPGVELMEQAAGAYRSASGYAVATILAPLSQSGVSAGSQPFWWAPMFGQWRR
ncbi:MAG: hypothetical protein R3D67_13070 [Hyphomicrobiaceae bacterium]